MQSRDARIGILGDGQLALMLAEAALHHGIDFLAAGSDPESSFARSFPDHFVLLNLQDLPAHVAFARRCSVLTLENEFYSHAFLKQIEMSSSVLVIPNLVTYAHFENKIAQRSFYDSLGIPGPRWAKAPNEPHQILTLIQENFSFPVMLKASQGGYDGYGVSLVQNPENLLEALLKLKPSQESALLIEEAVEIKLELAQGALFDGRGNYISLPLVETVQRNGICEFVLSRPRLNQAELLKVSALIQSAFAKLAKTSIEGLFHFEFFFTQGNALLINEGAPRPHNSQHLTLDASPLSQFDLLALYLKKRELPDSASPIPIKDGLMLNLLGKSHSEDYTLQLPSIPPSLQVSAKLYAKKQCRAGRKMGHLNLIDETESIDLLTIGKTILKDYFL